MTARRGQLEERTQQDIEEGSKNRSAKTGTSDQKDTTVVSEKDSHQTRKEQENKELNSQNRSDKNRTTQNKTDRNYSHYRTGQQGQNSQESTSRKGQPRPSG
jgi:hypothetical protein